MNILARIYGLAAQAQDHFTMLEFGACDGQHTHQFLEMLRSTGKPFTFHAFEPVKSNLAACEYVTRAHAGTFWLWNLAVGAEDGERDFYISGGQKIVDGRVADQYYGSSSIRAPKLCAEAWPEMTFTKSTTQVISLDSFAAQHLSDPVRPIDFIWADIQGAEVDMVRGGAKTWSRVRYLYTEYCDTELYEGEIGLAGIRELLPDFDVVEDYGGDVLLKNRNLP